MDMKKTAVALSVAALAATTIALPAAASDISSSAGIQIAAYNPCAAKKGCNPCAVKKACNPCAAKNPCNPCGANPCNPCGASGGAVSAKCVVPRLATAWKSSPCNPCNPCGASNPCNPCGGAPVAEISAAEASTLYSCLKGEMAKAYGKAGVRQISGYQNWLNIAAAPYQSATHGNRYVNNYADAHGDYRYKKFEKAGKMPQGTVLAKDSFVVRPDGKVSVGPMFIMQKMVAGFRKSTGDWRYSMILPNGKVAGITGGKGMSMKFCAECHESVAPDQDYIMLLPDEFRKTF